jgi:hypothetical protein
LDILISGILFAYLDAISLVGPLAKIDQFAPFAAKRTGAVASVPLVFFAALRAGYYRRNVILEDGFKFR